MAPKPKKDKDDEGDKLTRIAVVEENKCKPKKCQQECKKYCPVVKVGMSLYHLHYKARPWHSRMLCKFE